MAARKKSKGRKKKAFKGKKKTKKRLYTRVPRRWARRAARGSWEEESRSISGEEGRGWEGDGEGDGEGEGDGDGEGSQQVGGMGEALEMLPFTQEQHPGELPAIRFFHVLPRVGSFASSRGHERALHQGCSSGESGSC